MGDPVMNTTAMRKHVNNCMWYSELNALLHIFIMNRDDQKGEQMCWEEDFTGLKLDMIVYSLDQKEESIANTENTYQDG